MKVHILHTGRVRIDQALAYKEKSIHPAPYTGWFRGNEKKMWVPVSSYLIEHPTGYILIDTGWHEQIRENQKKHLGRFSNSMYTGDLPNGQSVLEQLRSKGIQSHDISLVLLTHLHSDHVSGLQNFKDAKRILTSDIEWKAANRKMGYIKSMWEGIPIETFIPSAIPHGPFKLGLDLFGDGSIYLVHTPGHSAGMFSVMVKMKEDWLLLASDVGYSKKSWQKMILPGVTVNKSDAEKSLQWVRDFSKRKDCILTAANHDPLIRPQTIF
ncbi:N-acyl homoserine lactonase family protein [Jeotgalibacillus sp. ET6]|uniref:N-acyl homoserine lactonase family protein n=1 Tax=Jeotgalibacillus sp. ET6 TaxID=3037260 RepID=UPI002418A015|nr:N-acyl homoserine lactonase family protein [Jeotgalibacillus sp. ET6]MDG5472482.1 N-acyl homoserine lactonase family protein [Jeotgalibacillus sp. ET6]